ncbi:cupin domain-containing protein [uncultured Ferrimonas sp.]|uniref:cupin domain-containing protein n=1 Tax=uncultured Ferrimonas sp. TaxID=432640 RepID=UPI002618BF25|nr:cupin domain-containing protein [uncultured Ferrimonas sp.]
MNHNKLPLLVATSLLLALPASASTAETQAQRNITEHGHFISEQQPYQQATHVPFVSTPYAPAKTMPEQCRDPKVEAYIAAWERGEIDFNSIEADATIAQDKRGCTTIDDDGNYITMAKCSLDNAPVGYMWKELSDWPVTIGITNGKPSDHNPHFHGQPECYYAVSGRARTLAQGQYQWMETGDYFYIPGNTIHNTPIEDPSGFGVLYWYPKNGHFDGFKYYWRNDVKYLRPAEAAFDEVDLMRKAAMGLNEYGDNESYFDAKRANAK